MPTWSDRIRDTAKAGRDWSKARLEQAQTKIRAGIDRLSENPDLPEGIREQLRQTRIDVFDLVKGVRSPNDLRQLRPGIAEIMAARITGIAEWTAEHPGDFTTLEDVERLCDSTIMWTAGTVDSVGFVAGAFAVAAGTATAGISFAHFFVLCYVMGLLASLSDGTAELYSITSWLAHQGHPDPAGEAVRLCAAPRHQKPPNDSDPGGLEAADDEVDPDPKQQPARQLAWRWAKLSLAAGLPVFNDRYMARENAGLLRRLRETGGTVA